MPPVRRTRLLFRPRSPTAAADTGGSRGWLSALRRKPSKRPHRAAGVVEDEGTPLSDEILVGIFDGFPEVADLVRCAFTCRRWRRLVSSEAAFLCRTPRRPPDRFIRPLALGFFHHQGTTAPRFVPMATASRVLGLQRPPSLNTLVEGLDDGLLDRSRVVASRNGLLVVELRRRGKRDRALKLCVCNPMTGEAHLLPPLRGKDGLGHYACTVLTAADVRDTYSATDPPSASYYRVVMVYSRRGFTACRNYSTDGGGAWSPEAEVTGAQFDKKKMRTTGNGVVTRGGTAAYWLAKNVVFGLRLDTLTAVVEGLPSLRDGACPLDTANTLLGLSPAGKLTAVHIDRPFSLSVGKRRVTISVSTYGGADDIDRLWLWMFRGRRVWDRRELTQVDQSLPDDVTSVRLRWFCQRSGVVFFTAGAGDGGERRREVYALSLGTQTVEKVASHPGGGDPWGSIHGYEMDQEGYLTCLAERDDIEEHT
ncbi:hypothetical protein ACP70R_003378 [Stipagrostis hirtigluma subsp. patula]